MTEATDNSRTAMIGPVGRTVIANVERLRSAQRVSLRGLSARLAALGRPIGPNQLQVLSKGGRRVDSDDLAALAEALGVTVVDLLEPPPPGGPIDGHPALLAARSLSSRVADLIATAGDPQATERAAKQADRALRRVQLEVEELLADAGNDATDEAQQ